VGKSRKRNAGDGLRRLHYVAWMNREAIAGPSPGDVSPLQRSGRPAGSEINLNSESTNHERKSIRKFVQRLVHPATV
jgi:hypothetical protein